MPETSQNNDEKTASAQPGLSSDDRPTDEDVGGNDDGDGDAESVDSKDELRMSKAKCIALVCTVTGASFLNVSFI